MDFFDGLKMGRIADFKLPKEIVVIGVEPENVGAGTELSPKVNAALPMVIEKVKSEF
jgi:hydrogenase maturation protease